MFEIPIGNMEPDFDTVRGILDGSIKSNRVFWCELLIDEEIQRKILEDKLGEKYYSAPISQWGPHRQNNLNGNSLRENYKRYYVQAIKFWHYLGYSMFTDLTFITNFESLNNVEMKTQDTAINSKGERHWAVEGTGMIKTWDDFEKFPWDQAYHMMDEYESYLEIINTLLPSGMKIGVVGTLFEELLEWIFGYEQYFYMLVDNPDLIQATNDRVAEIMYDFYKRVIDYNCVGYIFHADDLGYKNDTLISIEYLNHYIFPWFKKYAELAHEKDKPFYLHSCGKKDKIMDILINEVRIDAIHSFEDVSYPVTKYKKKYGKDVGIIGGIDVDKLVRMEEDELRKYIIDTLEICTENGRYVFGSGNSVANYIPVENYLILIDEALKWNHNVQTM